MSKNIIKSFNDNEFGEIRTIEENGRVLFCGSDVARSLGYSKPNNAISAHCKAALKRGIPISGKIQDVNFISESDVYRLIAHSKLPSAERFESWVFDEVLPTIRKTGGYVANDDLFINTYLPFADDNTKTLFRAALTTITNLNTKIEQDKPLVEFAEHIQVSDDCISMGDMAKLANKNGVKIGRNRLFAFLRSQKVLKQDNIPYQRYIESQSWFQVKESVYDTANFTRICLTTMVTPTGQKGIIKMLKNSVEKQGA